MKVLLSLIWIVMVQPWIMAQNPRSFGQLSFTEPVNWTFTDNGAYCTYSVVNNTSNIFCIISVYSSDISSGDPDKDFRTAWKGIVAGHFTVIKNLKPQQNTSIGGINYLQDEANVSNNQGSFLARLLVFNLNGKTQPVLFLSGNKNSMAQYQADLDRFVSSLRQNNSATTVSVINANDTTSGMNSITGSAKTLTTPSGLMHFNHMLFKIPPGWKTAQQGNLFMMTPPDLEPDEMLSYIFLPSVTDTSFNDVAVSTLKEVATGMNGEAVQEQIFGKGPLYIQENEGKYGKGWEFSKGHGTIRLAYPDPNSPGVNKYEFYSAGVFLAKIHSRIERVIYISKDIRRGFNENSTYRKPTYESIIKNFFFDLDFDDWTNAKVNPGKITHTGISHLWGGLAYFEGSLGQTFFEGSVKATYLVFFDNGQVYYNKELPKEGLLNINTFTQAAIYPRWWGTYTYQDGAGVIKLLYVTIPFTLKDGKVYLDIYQKKIPYDLLPAPDDMKLNGTWCEHAEYDGKKACISFTGNGQFTDNGVISRIEHQINNAFHSIPGSGQGNYEIKNNSIIFHYSSGLTYQAAFSGLNIQKGNPSPNEIHLGYNDDVFEKQ
ncbi:MAG: hypothetical protein Q8941_16770 [Bacteroidota bacterium]|nr:hypothetical protein [Bacteroidota bacterium]